MDRTDITELLTRVAAGDEGAREALWRAVHGHLREVARRQVGREGPGHTLQPTELVHEAFLKLDRADREAWRSRQHFFGAAARAMRQILIDHARGRRPFGDVAELELADFESEALGGDVEALEQALQAMGADPALERHLRIVELRFFAQVTIEETAELLEVSTSTVKRDWEFARAWLLRRMRAARVP